MVLRGPGRGVMTYHTTGVSQSGSVRLGCSQKDSLRPCRVRRKPVLHYRTRLSAHATIRGGPGQPGERHTQCVRSPGPVPSSCAAVTTAVHVCGSKCVRGYVSCREFYRSEYRKPGRSNARLCRALHECAVLYSGASASLFGRSKQPRAWRRRSDARCERRPMNSLASVRRQTNPCCSSSIRFSRGEA
jgi:hypothetical protein